MNTKKMAFFLAVSLASAEGVSLADSGKKALYAAKEDMNIVIIAEQRHLDTLGKRFVASGFRMTDGTGVRPDCMVLAETLPSGGETQYGMFCHEKRASYQGGTFVFSDEIAESNGTLVMLPRAVDILYRNVTRGEYRATEFIRLPWISGICVKEGCIPLYPPSRKGS